MTTLEPAGEPAAAAAAEATLRVSDLEVTYRVRGQSRPAVRSISFEISARESYGLVGESGSGKSTVALALTRYLPRNGAVTGGSISIAGKDPLAMNAAALRQMRARTVSMVYQEPGRALNPSIKAGRQIAEVYEIAGLRRDEALGRAEDMLRKVQIADPRQVMDRYPHQLSGGMAQRVVIAMALAAEPALLILDEPTTALDATVEAEVLDLVAGLRAEMATSVLFISHNLAVIAKMCDRVGVLYAGELVEEGPAGRIFDQASHPYTVGLLRCIPRRGQRKDHGRLDAIPGFLPAPGQQITGCIFAERCALVVDECRATSPPAFGVGPEHTARCYRREDAAELPRSTPADASLPSAAQADEPIVSVSGLSTTYKHGDSELRALTGVDLQIMRGETLGLVGESGSGKTTLARALLGLVEPDQGSVIEFDGAPLPADLRRRPLDLLRSLQIVFQNPDSALNRRHTVRRLISRPLSRLAGLSGSRLAERLADLIRSVRMEPRHLNLRPGQLSGGLKQRVAIATRCFRPPESCPGRMFRWRGSIRTDLIRSASRSARRLPDRPASLASGRLIRRRTVCRRFSAESGFWNTICRDLSRSSGRWRRSAGSGAPSNSIIEPSSGSTRPSSALASVVLPLPDSPTRPSVSPRMICRPIPVRALSSAPPCLYVVDSPCTDTIGSPASATDGSEASAGVLRGSSAASSCR